MLKNQIFYVYLSEGKTQNLTKIYLKANALCFFRISWWNVLSIPVTLALQIRFIFEDENFFMEMEGIVGAQRIFGLKIDDFNIFSNSKTRQGTRIYLWYHMRFHDEYWIFLWKKILIWPHQSNCNDFEGHPARSKEQRESEKAKKTNSTTTLLSYALWKALWTVWQLSFQIWESTSAVCWSKLNIDVRWDCF